MISISNTVYDTDGTLVIYDTARCRLGEIPARVARQATLDGGAVLSHYGVSHGDRIFRLDCNLSDAQISTLKNIHELSTSVLVSCSEGLFLGAIRDIDFRNGITKCAILIKERIN